MLVLRRACFEQACLGGALFEQAWSERAHFEQAWSERAWDERGRSENVQQAGALQDAEGRERRWMVGHWSCREGDVGVAAGVDVAAVQQALARVGGALVAEERELEEGVAAAWLAWWCVRRVGLDWGLPRRTVGGGSAAMEGVGGAHQGRMQLAAAQVRHHPPTPAQAHPRMAWVLLCAVTVMMQMQWAVQQTVGELPPSQLPHSTQKGR